MKKLIVFMKRNVFFVFFIVILAFGMLGIFSFLSVQAAPGYCAGCLFNERCIPYGIRALDASQALFCSEQGKMEAQQAVDSQCRYGYQCESNLCLQGKCQNVKKITDETSNFKILAVKGLCRMSNPFSNDNYIACVEKYGVEVGEIPAAFPGNITNKTNATLNVSLPFVLADPANYSLSLAVYNLSAHELLIAVNSSDIVKNIVLSRSLYEDKSYRIINYFNSGGRYYLDAGLVPETTYYYKARAEFFSGNLSAFSSVASSTTFSRSISQASYAGPKGLNVQKSNGGIVLKWENSK